MIHEVANIQEFYDGAKNEILIAKHILRDRKEIWKTLVHEYAHSYANNQDFIAAFQNDLLNATFILAKKWCHPLRARCQTSS